jgi:hypothetical protein
VRLIECAEPERLVLRGRFRFGEWTYGVRFVQATRGTLIREVLCVHMRPLAWPLSRWASRRLGEEWKPCALLLKEHLQRPLLNDERLPALQAGAAARAASNGHQLTTWSPVPGEEGRARRTSCLRCGRDLYIRTHDRMIGAMGTLMTSPCTTEHPPPAQQIDAHRRRT